MSLLPNRAKSHLLPGRHAQLSQLGVIDVNEDNFFSDDETSSQDESSDSESDDESDGIGQDDGAWTDEEGGLNDGAEMDDGMLGSDTGAEDMMESGAGAEGREREAVGAVGDTVAAVKVNLWSDDVDQAFWPRPFGVQPPEHLMGQYEVQLSEMERDQAMFELDIYRETLEPILAGMLGEALLDSLPKATFGMSDVMRSRYSTALVDLDTHPDRLEIVQSLEADALARQEAFASSATRTILGVNSERTTMDAEYFSTAEQATMDQFFVYAGIDDEELKAEIMGDLIEMSDPSFTAMALRLNDESYSAVDERDEFLALHPEYASFVGDKPLPAGREMRVSRDPTERPLSGVEAVMEEARVRVAEFRGFAEEERDIIWDGKGMVNPPMRREGVEDVKVKRVHIPTQIHDGKAYRIFDSDQHLPLGLFQSHERTDPETIFTTLLPLINAEMSSVVWFSPFVKIPVLWRITMQLENFFSSGGLLWVHTGVGELRGGGYEQILQLQESVLRLGGRLEVTLGSNPESAATNHAKGLTMQVARTGAILFAALSANIGESGLGSDIGAHQYPRYFGVNCSNELLGFSTSLFTIINGELVGTAWEFLREMSETLASEWAIGRLFLPLARMFQLRPDDTTLSTGDKTSVQIAQVTLISRLFFKVSENTEDRYRASVVLDSLQQGRQAGLDESGVGEVERSAFQAKLLGLVIPKPKLPKARAGAKAAKAEAEMFEELLRKNPALATALDEMQRRDQIKKATNRQAELRATTLRIRKDTEANDKELATPEQLSALYPNRPSDSTVYPPSSRPSAPSVPRIHLNARAVITDSFSTAAAYRLSLEALRERAKRDKNPKDVAHLLKAKGSAEWIASKKNGDEAAKAELAAFYNMTKVSQKRTVATEEGKARQLERKRVNGAKFAAKQKERTDELKKEVKKGNAEALKELESIPNSTEWKHAMKRKAEGGDEAAKIWREDHLAKGRASATADREKNRKSNKELRDAWEKEGNEEARDILLNRQWSPEWRKAMEKRLKDSKGEDRAAFLLLAGKAGTDQWYDWIKERQLAEDPTADVEYDEYKQKVGEQMAKRKVKLAAKKVAQAAQGGDVGGAKKEAKGPKKGKKAKKADSGSDGEAGDGGNAGGSGGGKGDDGGDGNADQGEDVDME